MIDFTAEEKQMIVCGLDAAYEYIEQQTEQILLAQETGLIPNEKLLARITHDLRLYERNLALQQKIFESLDEGEEKQGLLEEIAQNKGCIASWKEELGILEDVREPEAVND